MGKKKNKKSKKRANSEFAAHSNQDLNKPELMIGGQAVIEGVLMRGPDKYAVAIRHPSGRFL